MKRNFEIKKKQKNSITYTKMRTFIFVSLLFCCFMYVSASVLPGPVCASITRVGTQGFWAVNSCDIDVRALAIMWDDSSLKNVTFLTVDIPRWDGSKATTALSNFVQLMPPLSTHILLTNVTVDAPFDPAACARMYGLNLINTCIRADILVQVAYYEYPDDIHAVAVLVPQWDQAAGVVLPNNVVNVEAYFGAVNVTSFFVASAKYFSRTSTDSSASSASSPNYFSASSDSSLPNFPPSSDSSYDSSPNYFPTSSDN